MCGGQVRIYDWNKEGGDRCIWCIRCSNGAEDTHSFKIS